MARSGGIHGGRAFSQGSFGGASETDDRFGAVVALADFNGDGVAELTVGVPGEEVAGEPRAGMVYVSRAFDARLVFLDGFDGGDTTRWSAAVP